MADTSVDKRARKVDALLASEEFTDYFAGLWGEALRLRSVDWTPRGDSHKGVVMFARWIRDQIAADRPLDEFVSDMMTATGNTMSHCPTNL